MGRAATSDDCNDAAPAVHPGAAELCNGIDANCDGSADVGCPCRLGATSACGAAAPGGGFYTIAPCHSGLQTCVMDTSGTNSTWTSCAGNYDPASVESCATPEDDDCNGLTNDSAATDATDWYPDVDGDTFGSATVAGVRACASPAVGYVNTHSDCDDANGAVHPGAIEACNSIDDNCTGGIDEGLTAYGLYPDCDRDGYGVGALPITSCVPVAGPAACPAGGWATVADQDCNDASAAVHPGAAETCNRVDDNCNGVVDEGVTTAYFADCDRDGHGAGIATDLCSAPTSAPTCATGLWATIGDDCDDARALIYPGAAEFCDGRDDNCNGLVDGLGDDDDGDGYLDPSCSPTGTDCDDARADTHPGAAEVCDRYDSNCTVTGHAHIGAAAAVNTVDLTEDADNDHHSAPTAACTGGYPKDDCDDTRATIYLGAPEICDGRDTNCDGLINGPGEDDDLDGYIDAGCGGLGNDCDDSRADTHPGAVETCDRYDSNCSVAGHVRVGVAPVVNSTDITEDRDNDGHSALLAACAGGFLRDDCNDSHATDYPGAVELCDGRDNDCDTLVDEEPAATADCLALTPASAASRTCVGNACTAVVCNSGYVPFCGGCVTPAEFALVACGDGENVTCGAPGTYWCACDPRTCAGCCAGGCLPGDGGDTQYEECGSGGVACFYCGGNGCFNGGCI